MKPYYDDGQCVIYHGDCREILPTLEPVDTLITDPPYGIGWKPRVNHADQRWVDERIDIDLLAVGDRHCIWGGNYFTDTLPPTESWLLWIKRPYGLTDTIPKTYALVEMAWTDFGGKPRTRHHSWDGSLRAGDASNRTFCHPAQKPLEVMRWCVELSGTPPGGVVLDPFMGSGTTLRAAADCGLRAIGIETDEAYCEIAAKRLAQGVLDFGASA